MQRVSERLSRLPQADIREMTRECQRLGGYNLSQGVCDLPTPKEILNAAAAAVNQDLSVYAPAQGVEKLRRLMADKVNQENKIDCSYEDIIVTNGVTGAFASILMALFEPGDGVMLIEPYYGYHFNECIVTNLQPQVACLNSEMKIERELLEQAVRSNTRAVVVCTPSNPSGRMFDESELKEVLAFAEKHDLLVISDEIYEYFKYDGRTHLSPAAVADNPDRVISMMGLSKTFSITGWRLGYVVSPKWANKAISKTNDLLYVCAATPLQHGAVAGFELDKVYFQDLIKTFTGKRDRFCKALESAGLKPVIPQGSYYVLADISSLDCSNSVEASMQILKQAKVASVPGDAFFQSDRRNDFVRFCFAVDDDILNGAIENLIQFGNSRA